MVWPRVRHAVASTCILLVITACGPERRDADDDGVSIRDGDCDDFDAAVGDRALDADCDGIFTDFDCDDNDPTSTAKADDFDCDGVLTDDDCDDSDPTSMTRFEDLECDGFFLADNGVTVRFPDAALDTSGAVDGKTYVRRDRSFLKYSATAEDFTSACTTGITDMSEIFFEARYFNLDIGSWDTSNVTDMSYMFRSAQAFNQDLSGWCVSKIRSTPGYFAEGASSWTLPQPVWGTCP